MSSSGYLVPPSKDPAQEKLWVETWKRIDRFLPDLKNELTFDEPEPEPAPEPAPVSAPEPAPESAPEPAPEPVPAEEEKPAEGVAEAVATPEKEMEAATAA